MSDLLALDQGTSSSRTIVFRHDGQIHSLAQQTFRQIYPQPGWVEHDPQDIWNSQWATLCEALRQGGPSAADITALGIANQRETTMVWGVGSQDRRADARLQVSEIRVDGGACANDLLMKMQADLLRMPVTRPATVGTTALGAALLAGVGCGLYRQADELNLKTAVDRLSVSPAS